MFYLVLSFLTVMLSAILLSVMAPIKSIFIFSCPLQIMMHELGTFCLVSSFNNGAFHFINYIQTNTYSKLKTFITWHHFLPTYSLHSSQHIFCSCDSFIHFLITYVLKALYLLKLFISHLINTLTWCMALTIWHNKIKHYSQCNY